MARWRGLITLTMASLGLLLLVLLVQIQFVSYSVGYYQSEFAKLDQPANLGTSLEQLRRFSAHTTRFLAGLEDDPNLQMVLYGQERWLLNEKEISHMQDVQKLFQTARILSGLGLAIVLVSGVLSWRRRSWSSWLRGVAQAAGFALLAGLLIGWLISRDFTAAFDRFHLLAFTNDLWLLNPAEDQLINLLPEQFFADAVWLAALRSAGTLLLVSGSAAVASLRRQPA